MWSATRKGKPEAVASLVDHVGGQEPPLPTPPVDSLAAAAVHADEADLSHHGEMSRGGRLGDPDALGGLADAAPCRADGGESLVS